MVFSPHHYTCSPWHCDLVFSLPAGTGYPKSSGGWTCAWCWRCWPTTRSAWLNMCLGRWSTSPGEHSALRRDSSYNLFSFSLSLPVCCSPSPPPWPSQTFLSAVLVSLWACRRVPGSRLAVSLSRASLCLWRGEGGKEGRQGFLGGISVDTAPGAHSNFRGYCFILPLGVFL